MLIECRWEGTLPGGRIERHTHSARKAEQGRGVAGRHHQRQQRGLKSTQMNAGAWGASSMELAIRQRAGGGSELCLPGIAGADLAMLAEVAACWGQDVWPAPHAAQKRVRREAKSHSRHLCYCFHRAEHLFSPRIHLRFPARDPLQAGCRQLVVMQQANTTGSRKWGQKMSTADWMDEETIKNWEKDGRRRKGS